MENSPRNQSEEDKAAAAKAELNNDDDDDEEEESKPAPRHAPGISFEKVKEDGKKREKPRLSITDRLLESIGAKPKEGENADKPVHEVADEELEESEAHEPTATLGENADSSLESADWEVEDTGVLKQAGASRLSPGEVRTDANDEQGEFVNIPTEHEASATEDTETEPVEPELMESGLGSEGPPDPPEDEPPGAEDEPEDAPPPPSTTTTHYYRSGGGGGSSSSGSPWYSAAAADRARRQELDDAEYYGRREGTRRGALTGLLFGWLIGRHGKKKQGREFIKEIKSKEKQINSLKNEQNAAALRLEAVQRTQEQLAANIRAKGPKVTEKLAGGPQKAGEALAGHERPAKNVEKRLVSKVVEVLPLKAVVNRETEKIIEKSAEALEVAAVSAALAAVERTTHKRVAREQIEAGKQAPEEQEITQATYEVESGRRVETSAWHRIEIDEKTGRPVENPEVSYGKEFKRERAKEVFSEDSSTSGDSKRDKDSDGHSSHQRRGGPDVGSPAAQLGGLAAASFTNSAHTDETYSDSRPPESGLAAGIPQMKHPDHLKHSSLLRFASDPIVWVIAALIVVILFVLGVLR